MKRRTCLGVLCVVALLTAGVSWTPRVGAAEDAGDGFYDPVQKQLEGWTLAVDPKLLAAENRETADRAFAALANHLQRVKFILPEAKVAQLQKLPIWIELDNKRVGSMQYHPDAGWLRRMKHDPRMVKHVHIPRARALFSRGTWVKHPYVILHELAHAYHDQVLGFNHAGIVEAYKAMKQEGIYEKVLLYTGRKVRHYALTNHKELLRGVDRGVSRDERFLSVRPRRVEGARPADVRGDARGLGGSLIGRWFTPRPSPATAPRSGSR